jgi:hypothetical protein
MKHPTRAVVLAVAAIAVLAAAAPAGAAANRAPRDPGLLAPTCCVEDTVRYSNHNDMTIWASSSDPDRDAVSYRFRVFLYGSPATLYDSGWHAGQPGWGFAAKVPASAPIRAGMTYLLMVRARDSHGAMSNEVPFSYSVFSNAGKASTQPASWYQQEFNLNDNRTTYNNGLTQAGNSYMRQKLYDLAMKDNSRCHNGELPSGLRSQMITRNVGFMSNVTLLGAAMNSLQTVWREIQVKEPVLSYVVQSSGSLCYRSNRPSGTSLSNHSWGTAIDVNYGGGAPETYRGNHNASMYLYRLWRFMHAAGWYWGGGFSNQDNMHFEASVNQLDYWLLLGVAHHG